jgi:hypothetical protein
MPSFGHWPRHSGTYRREVGKTYSQKGTDRPLLFLAAGVRATLNSNAR